MTIVAAKMRIQVPYGVLSTSEGNIVCEVKEKPGLDYLVNTGMYVLNPTCVSYIPKDEFFHMTDLIDFLIKNKKKVGFYQIEENAFLDMGDLSSMKKMEEKIIGGI